MRERQNEDSPQQHANPVPTVPNTQVTVSPELIVTDDGANARLGSAWILVSPEFCGLVDM